MAAQVALLAAIAVRTAVVIAVLGVGIRLVNKRHVGEMRLHDILLVLMASNAVQNSMTNGNGHLAVALVSAATLIFIGWLAAVAFDWSPLVERLLGAKPVIVVHDGVLMRRNLRRGRVSEEEVAAAIRDQGILRVRDVKLAVLETNGSISVVPRDNGG